MTLIFPQGLWTSWPPKPSTFDDQLFNNNLVEEGLAPKCPTQTSVKQYEGTGGYIQLYKAQPHPALMPQVL